MASNANELLFRASGCSHLMSDPSTIKAREAGELAEGVKTHLIDVFVSAKYNRFTEIHGKMLDKGNDVEEDSITIVSRKTKKVFKKNETSLSNEYIKGTPDLFEGVDIHNADAIRDTKSSWDAYTFTRAKYKNLPKSYHWQGQGYMALTGAKTCTFDFCLNNTPYHIVEGELRRESYKHKEGNTPNWIELMIIANHTYDQRTFEEYYNLRGCLPVDEDSKYVVAGFVDIPLDERHHMIQIERNDDDIERLYERIRVCREWMNKELFKVK